MYVHVSARYRSALGSIGFLQVVGCRQSSIINVLKVFTNVLDTDEGFHENDFRYHKDVCSQSRVQSINPCQ